MAPQMHLRLALATVLAGLSLPARADDTIAALGAGGLVLEKTEKVELRSEDLYLSTKEIRISYRFFNKTSQDLPVTIAFPMPDIAGSVNFMVAVPDDSTANFLKFETTVDGRPVTSQVEQRAFYAPEGKPEVEITKLLSDLGIPLMPTREIAGKPLADLPEARRQELLKAEYVYPDTYDSGKGEQTDFVPNWTLRSKFYRQQVFPAGKEVLVEQRYQPSVGGLSSLYAGTEGFKSGEEKNRYAKTWCTDADFLKGAEALVKTIEADKTGKTVANEQYLSYVITSGGNWAGPIGDYRLVVDKGYADNLVSFCGEGVKKISPTQFEMRVKNYKPDRDIDVLIVQRHS